ncbi:T9SS type B sorting domain-containing protein [Winogradskyella maritima]|uniref:T9SS type B sorting domain-containing protein n=1 Tax=Winogradskyella maritima TaxID=1517766 RepID=A0ABV8AGW5_9FLAO|nr:T9SS type B sorting domain-containing protein [Winogradskyella maritima]
MTVTGDQVYCPDGPLPVVSSIRISNQDPTATELPEVIVQISVGYEMGLDILSLSGVHPNISASWDATQGQLTLTGPATFEAFESAVSNVLFETTQTLFIQDRQISVNLSDNKYLPSTGHYYVYVSSPGISWSAARTEASQMTLFGVQGYLATITSEEEAQLTGEQSPGTGWIGATDVQEEGVWIWVTGPEAGTQFWQGGVGGSTVNGSFEFWNSGEPNNLGEEHYAHITDPSIGIPGSWNDLDNAGSPDPTNPYHPRGFFVEFGGLPGDPPLNLSASTEILMPRITIDDTPVEVCENVTIQLEATTNTTNILWYGTSTSPTLLNTGLSYQVNLSSSTTFWLQPAVDGCTNLRRYPLLVNVNPLPESADISVSQCDDAVLDGLVAFNLSSYDNLVSNGTVANRSVTYFEDASLMTEIDNSNYTNTSNGQIVYAKVTDTTSGCFSTAEVTLNVSSSSSEMVELEACDALEGEGFTNFDLSELDAQLLTGTPPGTSVDYYLNFEDALLQNNALPTDFSNTQAFEQTIFARVQDDVNCYGINTARLIVKPLPNILPDESIFYCLNTFPETIKINGGVVDDIPNNYFYNWSTGETTIEIEVNEPGDYDVEVRGVNGCARTRTITVVASSTAMFENFNVNNNTVTVNVLGEGIYDYSLDNPTGPFQESNTFTEVTPGFHDVYVNDRNGCGIVSQRVAVLGFSKYFTPNGDGNNDFWSIKGLEDLDLQISVFHIFNRHGKLIQILSASNPQWDGRYNGNPMPTDDYWFSGQLSDGQTISGHFALKR